MRRTLIVGDVHGCARELDDLLDAVRFDRTNDRLVLVGDLVARGPDSRGVVERVAEYNGAFVRGNHDDILAQFLPLDFENLTIVEDHIHEGPAGRYLVLHGDVFDTVTKNFVWLAHLGDWGYRALLKLNRAYNLWRAWRGLEYWSLSKAIKARVKSAVNHVSNFEEHIAALAKSRDCLGVMCGHIHTAADKMLGDIHYLNSGDWVESLTAIVEHHDGRFELIHYTDFLRTHPLPSEEAPESELIPT